MTPEEAREIDRLEFETECRAVRERAFARIADRHGVERARVVRWVKTERPATSFNRKFIPKPKATAIELVVIARPRRQRPPSARTAYGMAKTLHEWADYLGITYNSLCTRIHRLGSLEAAIDVGDQKNTRRRRPGVVANFRQPVGTGGGPIAQDISEIEFSQ